MEFKIKNQWLYKNIKKINKIVSNIYTNDLYNLINVEVLKNEIILSCVNEKNYLKIYLKNKENLFINKTGSFLINLKLFYELLSKIKDEWIFFNEEKNSIIITNKENSTNSFVLKLNKTNGKNFPNILVEEKETTNQFSLFTKEIQEIITKLSFVIDINNSKESLRGINFHLSENEIIITAADNISLAQKRIKIKNKEKTIKEITIPLYLINNIEKIADEDDKINIVVNENKIFVEGKNFILIGPFINNEYLRIQDLTEKFLRNEKLLKININDVEKFINIIDLSAILSKKDQVPLIELKFDQKNNRVKVLCISNNSSIGIIEEQYQNLQFAEKNNQETVISIIFNYFLLTNALKSFVDCQTVTLNIAINNHRTVINSNENESITQLILPFIKK